MIKNPKNMEIINEKILHCLILENIENFMSQLGSNYAFIGSEYKIKIGNRYNYIDILLYNIKFKCYVVVELKIIELTSKHIGKIEKYINYVDKKIKTVEENNTIGIIIVKKNNKFVMEYISDKRILSREYKVN